MKNKVEFVKKAQEYRRILEEYSVTMKRILAENVNNYMLESNIESIKDWSLHYSIEEVCQWFEEKRLDPKMKVESIPLNQLNGWMEDRETGNIFHESGEFFTVHGIRVKTNIRETAQAEWDQPVLTQVGYDGGIVGVLRQRHEGIPHYLVEAKVEPGNYRLVQLSPTLQATFSNLKKAHKGRKPFFTSYFIDDENKIDKTILFDAWFSEDGGRLFNKRNRGMLVEVDEDEQIKIPNERFIWLSLYQIKRLLKENAWVNPHLRSVIAHM